MRTVPIQQDGQLLEEQGEVGGEDHVVLGHNDVRMAPLHEEGLEHESDRHISTWPGCW